MEINPPKRTGVWIPVNWLWKNRLVRSLTRKVKNVFKKGK